MSFEYQALKQEASIYERLTGKKCSLFHHDNDTTQKMLKPPKAIYHRIMTQPNEQLSEKKYRKNRSIDDFLPQSKFEDCDEIYSGILKQGIKMTIMQGSKNLASKCINNHKKTQHTKRKAAVNPEKAPKMNRNSMRTDSDNKFNVANQSTQDTFLPQINTISSPAILDESDGLHKGKTKSAKQSKRAINFLSLNKSYITRIKSKQKAAFSQGLIGPTKKERILLDYKNRLQVKLQQELKTCHAKNQPFIEQMLQKYKIKFSKHSKYLKKCNRAKPIRTQSLQANPKIEGKVNLLNEALNFDELSEQVRHLDFHLMENRKRIKEVEQAIEGNDYHHFLARSETIQQIQSQNAIKEEAQESLQEEDQRKLSIIEKLKQSLIQLRQRNQKEDMANHKPLHVNERIKELLF